MPRNSILPPPNLTPSLPLSLLPLSHLTPSDDSKPIRHRSDYARISSFKSFSSSHFRNRTFGCVVKSGDLVQQRLPGK